MSTFIVVLVLLYSQFSLLNKAWFKSGLNWPQKGGNSVCRVTDTPTICVALMLVFFLDWESERPASSASSSLFDSGEREQGEAGRQLAHQLRGGGRGHHHQARERDDRGTERNESLRKCHATSSYILK